MVFCTEACLLVSGGILTYNKQYQLPASYLLSDHCTASKIEEICQSRIPVEFYNRVMMMIKKNILHVPFEFLDRNVISVCISAVCLDRF